MMHIPGHIAVALTQHSLPPLSKEKALLPPLLIACIFPDAVDKTIGYVFKAMPNGRHYAHNIFSLFGVALLVSLIWNRRIGLAWFLGYLGHLLADQSGLVPWLFPLQKYHFCRQRFQFNSRRFFKELALLALVIIIYRMGE